MKVYLYTDLHIDQRRLFWHRDLGLLTKAFRKLGHDAWLVVHPAKEFTRQPPTATRHNPVIWASPSDVRNPKWWQSHQPDLIILGLWTRPKYDPIRRAALSATPRVIERADSDGMRTASCGVRAYARRRYDFFRDFSNNCPALFSTLASFLYSLASIFATPYIEARLARTLRLLPAIAVETPQATRRWRALAVRLGNNPAKICCIPHPIQTDLFKYHPYIHKKNHIISVGRWESYQKNLPLLAKTLVKFLGQNPTWKATVNGSGLCHSSPYPRIRFLGHLSARALAQKMRASKIFLSSSRYESFGMAAAEAVLCGCQVVAPRGCMPWWTGAVSNQVAADLSGNLQKASTRRPPSRSACLKIHRRLNPLEIARKMLRISRLPRVPTQLPR